MKLRQEKNMFISCVNYMFKSIIKTFQTYIYVLILPMIVVGFIFLLTQNRISSNHRYILISSYLLLPLIFNFLLIGHICCKWRETIFLKQLNNFGITKLQFILSLLIIIFIISLVSVFFIMGYLFILSYIIKTNSMNEWIKNSDSFLQWFGFFLTLFLNILVIFFIAFLISCSFSNIYLLQTLNIIVIILFIFFGDFLIDLSYSSSQIFNILGYFIPQKFATWTMYFFYSKTEICSSNVFIIIPSLDYPKVFNSIYQPIFSLLGFIILFAVISYYRFLPSIKK